MQAQWIGQLTVPSFTALGRPSLAAGELGRVPDPALPRPGPALLQDRLALPAGRGPGRLASPGELRPGGLGVPGHPGTGAVGQVPFP